MSLEQGNKYNKSIPKKDLEVKRSQTMPVEELLEMLKPYPTLQSIVLRNMTDEEFERYVFGDDSSEQNK